MSAFILSNKHINVLVNAVINIANQNDGHIQILNDDKIKLFTLDEAGQALIDQNYRSYNTRYNIDNLEQTPIYKFYYEAKAYKGVQILKACSCYDYQSCETNDYYETDAHKIIDDIRHLTISNLPGYDDAEWDMMDPIVA